MIQNINDLYGFKLAELWLFQLVWMDKDCSRQSLNVN